MEINETLQPFEQIYLENKENPDLPETHREEYARALAIASLVGDVIEEDERGEEIRFYFQAVESVDQIARSPAIYLFENDAFSLERADEVEDVSFKVNPKSLSGKVDAAHPVLPGDMTISFETAEPEKELKVPVVVKGSFKRDFEDRFERLKKEIKISQLQAENDEVAFQPIAAVIAPSVVPYAKSRPPQNDILLLTLYEEAAVSMDNSPWALGFTEDNLDAADRAIRALGRFNTTIGFHGDAKIKNIVQKPDGQSSMIDFETSKITDVNDPVEAQYAASFDLGVFFESLEDRGFFANEQHRTYEVVSALVETYLDEWADAPPETVDAVYQQAAEVAERYNPRNSYAKIA